MIIEDRLKNLEDRLTAYEKSGFWSRRDVLTGVAGLAGLGLLSQAGKAGSLLADMNASNPQVKINNIALVKTTAGQTINVSTSAEVATAMSNLAAAPSLLGNVIIQLAAGTYASAVTIPSLVGNGYSLTLQGGTTTNLTTTATGGTAGNVSTQSTVVKTGAGWTVNAYRGQWLKFTSGALINKIRVVNSNTADTITLCGNFFSSAPQNGDAFIIYSNNAEITGAVAFNMTTANVIFRNLVINNSSGKLQNLEFYDCKIKTGIYKSNLYVAFNIFFDRCFLETVNLDLCGFYMISGYVEIRNGCYAYGATGTVTFAVLIYSGHLLVRDGCVFENYWATVWARLGGSILLWGGDDTNPTKNFIKNNLTGIRAVQAGFIQVDDVVFSGNITDKEPTGITDPGWIS